jgi:hypothetical protein
VVGFADATALDEYLNANPNRTQAALLFSFNRSATPPEIVLTVQTNRTLQCPHSDCSASRRCVVERSPRA